MSINIIPFSGVMFSVYSAQVHVTIPEFCSTISRSASITAVILLLHNVEINENETPERNVHASFLHLVQAVTTVWVLVLLKGYCSAALVYTCILTSLQ